VDQVDKVDEVDGKGQEKRNGPLSAVDDLAELLLAFEPFDGAAQPFLERHAGTPADEVFGS